MYNQLEKSLNYKFTNTELLKEALSHSSYCNEKKINSLKSNERLEFLGDAVLELIVSNYIFNNYPDLTEGQLSKFRANVVCEESFSDLSRRLSLGDFLKLGKGEQQSGGAERNSILADVFEAVIGAIYLDSNFENVEKLVLDILVSDIKKMEKTFEISDYKTYLQEVIQAKSQLPVKYEVTEETGPSHNKNYKVCVSHNEKIIGIGEGKTKKEAEQSAAKNYLVTEKYI